MTKRILVSTISTRDGGVLAMIRFAVNMLSAAGFEPVIAHYEPYSVRPALSVPVFRVGQRRPNTERRTFEGHEVHAIGAWLPELEFANYLATSTWRRLMETCASYLAISGNILAATPFYQTDRQFLAWVASGRAEDRRQRAQRFRLPRRLFDVGVVSPVAAVLERAVLRSGVTLPISRYTQQSLRKIAGPGCVGEVMPVPVDFEFFTPASHSEVTGRVGFAGRLKDPRKNVELIIRSIATAAAKGLNSLTAVLVGEVAPDLSKLAYDLGVEARVSFVPPLDRVALREWLRSIDVFVVPSHQEGLCIIALEAMACGCPVVSTRCGGPEEFVLDDETGYVVDSDPAAMAEAIHKIVSDRMLRARLGGAARALVEREFSAGRAEAIFWNAYYAKRPTSVPAASTGEREDGERPPIDRTVAGQAADSPPFHAASK